jgi:ketosteroid isomerase-like protein
MASTDEDVFELADRLFTAIEEGDLASLHHVYDRDIVVWGNFDGRARDFHSSMKVLDWMITNLADRRYEVKRREAIEGGFLQEHVLHGTAPNGETIAMPACIIATVAEGRVTRINEYLDPAAMAALSGS